MVEWLRRLNPLYESQKSDVELLALAIASNMMMLRLDASMSRMCKTLEGASISDQPQYCEVTYEQSFAGKGKIRKWQSVLLSELVRTHLREHESIGM